MTSVLHVISQLSRGGPANALTTAAAASAAHGETSHALVSLTPPDPEVVRQAGERGVRVHSRPDRGSVRESMAAADIVQIDFWNSPVLYQLLGTELPETRLLVWSHVSGEHPPQVLPSELLELADKVFASCMHTTTLPGLEGLDCIPAVPDWDRIQGVRANDNREFTVGYLGKLDFGKLHPQFIDLCASIEVPRARFLVCGEGGALRLLRRQAADAGIAGRTDFRGFVEDVRSAFAEMDVLGYPLAPDTSAASELALQEAMYAGIPPVVMGPAAIRQHIIDGTTGLVAENGREYVQAIAHLHAHPEERTRIGEAAREFATRAWSPSQIGSRWTRVYEELAAQPKRRRPPLPLAETGAARFLQSLGDGSSPFLLSMTTSGRDALEGDQQIARSPTALCHSDGGILSYRDFYPDDPYLRFWSGLVLRQQGRTAIAAGEFAAALRLGLDGSRAGRHLAAAAREARTTDDAQQVLPAS
jgi:glycosyltransferase involved in cell wall biosynthesis